MAFKIAGSMAFKDAAKKAEPVLLEPIMKVEVVAPEEYMGSITGDINSRRGRIESMARATGTQVITALVPLSEMFGYSTDMRSMTQGRATYTMHFHRYEEAPQQRARGDHSEGARHREVIIFRESDASDRNRSWKRGARQHGKRKI